MTKHTDEFKARIADEVLSGRCNKLQASRRFEVTWKTVDSAVKIAHKKAVDELKAREYGEAAERLSQGEIPPPPKIELGTALREAVREEVKKHFTLLLTEFLHGRER